MSEFYLGASLKLKHDTLYVYFVLINLPGCILNEYFRKVASLLVAGARVTILRNIVAYQKSVSFHS